MLIEILLALPESVKGGEYRGTESKGFAIIQVDHNHVCRTLLKISSYSAE